MSGFDLGESAEDADDDPADQESVEDVEQTEPSVEDTTSEEVVDPKEEPPFGTEDVRQYSTYPREDILEKFQQIDTAEVQPFLVTRGVKNVETREIHDALYRMAIENPERLGELIMEGRGLDPDN
ncbi:hypothetical protein ACOZ32_00550 [Halobacterium sp. MBLA0001]|uniref:Uncharacterized protein n=1 Tax=Halarchaeum rubridurum TaxID=489911 RepID=A0A830G3T1_9EURY|nr:hypothetical protein [Halarchaeum rubridurum]MBP1956002.1 hypothetical protein [Halarchaeum rubridurum]GGM73778.1 hypothetical protein GCM10009017_24630 [Halarchaeum rubridurum]